jgi:hypothetical protein
MTGVRTGRRRAIPLTSLPDGDRYFVTTANVRSLIGQAGVTHRRAPALNIDDNHITNPRGL